MNTLANTLAGVLLALCVTAPGAEAGILRAGNYLGSTLLNSKEAPLPLTNAGAKALTFSTAASNTLIIVTYSAECRATGEPGDYVTMRIAIDGTDAHPRAGTDFVLCAASSPNGYGRAGVSRQAFILLPRAGLHRVEVFATLLAVSGATEAVVQNSSIVIHD